MCKQNCVLRESKFSNNILMLLRYVTHLNFIRFGSVRFGLKLFRFGFVCPNFQKIDRFGSVRFELFSVWFGSVREKHEPIASLMTTLLVLDEVSFIMKILELPLCLKWIFNKLLLTTKKAVHLIEPYSLIFQSFLSQCIYGQPYNLLEYKMKKKTNLYQIV